MKISPLKIQKKLLRFEGNASLLADVHACEYISISSYHFITLKCHCVNYFLGGSQALLEVEKIF